MRVTENEHNYIKGKVEKYIGDPVDWKDNLIQDVYVESGYRTLKTLIKILKKYNYYNDKDEEIQF